MTRRYSLLEDALREMRSPVVPVDDPEVLEARRRRTVGHLQALQAQTVVRRQIAGSWRRRLFIAALVLLPSGAVAGTWVAWKTPPQTSAAPSSTTNPSITPRTVPGPLNAAVESVREEPQDGTLARGFGPALPGSSSQADGAPKTSGHGSLNRTTQVARSPAPGAASAPGPRESDASTLAAENALMQAAMAAARDGDDARSVQLLGGLLARYPRSPLAQNAEVERFRAVARLGEGRAAARLARRYLGEHPDGMARDEARRMGVERLPASSDAPRR